MLLILHSVPLQELNKTGKTESTTDGSMLTRRPLGLRTTRQPLGRGAYSCPLYFCDDIVATRRDRKTKRCTHLTEYLAEIVSKFNVDPI